MHIIKIIKKKIIQDILKNKRERKQGIYFIKAAQALNKVNIKALISVEKAFFSLDKNKKANADSSFNEAVLKIDFNDKNRAIWNKTFSLLSEYIIKNKIEKYDKTLEIEKTQSHEKIFVSGMGWSGSGAVLDYFKEYNSLKIINNEIVYFSRGISISKLENKFFNKDFKKYIKIFFKYTLFSNAIPTTVAEANSIYNNIFIFNDPASYYAKACFNFLYNIIKMKLDKNYNEVNYNKNASDFTNNILSSVASNKENKIILNNVITISKLEALKYTDNFKGFCIFRDPRSNFVARCEEDMKFTKSVDNYIKSYRAVRKKYLKDLIKNPEIAKNIQIVQFEDFVTSENYRKKISEIAGINLSAREEYKYFKPWESEKNIYNYKDFKDQKAIRKIEKKLSAYLWEKKT